MPPAAAPPPAPRAFSHRQCWLIGAAGVFVLAPDSLLLRMSDADVNVIVSLRALFSAAALALIIAWLPALRYGFRWAPVCIYGVVYAVGLSCFPLSIKATHVANTLVILSTAPMLAAVGAYFVLGERTRPATWAAALAIFLGMLIIFAGGIGGDGFVGDLLALGTAISLAAASIVVRRYPQTAVYPGLIVGGLIVAAVFAVPADWNDFGGRDVAILAVDGAIVMSVSFVLILTAARGLPPAELNLLFLLETILGPFWVWLFLGEVPPALTVAAGALIGAVLVLHTLWLLKGGKRAG